MGVKWTRGWASGWKGLEGRWESSSPCGEFVGESDGACEWAVHMRTVRAEERQGREIACCQEEPADEPIAVIVNEMEGWRGR